MCRKFQEFHATEGSYEVAPPYVENIMEYAVRHLEVCMGTRHHMTKNMFPCPYYSLSFFIGIFVIL